MSDSAATGVRRTCQAPASRALEARSSASTVVASTSAMIGMSRVSGEEANVLIASNGSPPETSMRIPSGDASPSAVADGGSGMVSSAIPLSRSTRASTAARAPGAMMSSGRWTMRPRIIPLPVRPMPAPVDPRLPLARDRTSRRRRGIRKTFSVLRKEVTWWPVENFSFFRSWCYPGEPSSGLFGADKPRFPTISVH